ncbi:hypothetical protein [Sphingomonas trueperi]|uniref:hypothetical protein n=1 Tax=Sphingomonas trueperi TaxID=53317 RepID=UPI0011C414F8
MFDEQEHNRAVERARALHAQEEREKAIARSLPPGPEQDEHWMLGERLSDTAWSIEEEFDLDAAPSGLWPEEQLPAGGTATRARNESSARMTAKPNKKARPQNVEAKRPSKGFLRRNRGLIAGAAGVAALIGGAIYQTRKHADEPGSPSGDTSA